MLLSFLFWNVDKRPRWERISRMASLQGVDVLILDECPRAPGGPEAALATDSGLPFRPAPGTSRTIRTFTVLPDDTVVAGYEDPFVRLATWQITVGSPPGLLLMVGHLPSRVSWGSQDQALGVTALAREVERIEVEIGTRHTILVGDLNMNPFDDGVVGAHALHAVATKELARRGERTVSGRTYPFFYNPMWGHFGDRTAGPPGTYYLRSSKPVNYYWNIYDQVLLRPELMDSLVDLQILDHDGEQTLLTEHGIPDRSAASDHLPVVFRLQV